MQYNQRDRIGSLEIENLTLQAEAIENKGLTGINEKIRDLKNSK